MKRVVLVLLVPVTVYAQDTTINYKGQPLPTAMAPSVNAMGNDICAIPISGAIHLFSKLARFEPAVPLTCEEWEWSEVSDSADGIMYQNNRMSSVFKQGKDGQAY